MADAEMKKVSAWIPQDTLTKLEEKGYHNRAEAIRLGLECLLMESKMESIENSTEPKTKDTKNPMESNGIHYEIYKDKIEELKRHSEVEVNYLKKEIERLTALLQETPNPVELADVRARFEGLQSLTEEKDKRIEDLTKEVETLNVFAHYFKNIEVKQIEAPVYEKVKPWWKFW